MRVPSTLDPKARILVIDDEADICRMLAMCLTADGHEVTSVATAAEAVGQNAARSFDVIFLDLRLGTDNGLDLIQPLIASSPWVRVIVITAYAAVDTAVEAMKRGASDYLSKPFTPAQVKLIVKKATETQGLARKAAELQEQVAASGPPVDYDTASAEMREAVELARSAAGGKAAVLIGGEAGVGKRTLGRAIHAWSTRAGRPLALAGSVAPTVALLEAEWFGSAKKMPGGNRIEQPGRVAYCDGGTLLVEDVDRLPLPTQAKLLRLIQDGQYEQQANFAPRQADVRVIATTAADLEALVAAGSFRRDLLDALHAVAIHLPPLRHRADDIEPLAARFLAFYTRHAAGAIRFGPAALELMRRHSWPGNLRELRNLVERAALVTRGPVIESWDLPTPTLNRVNAVALGDAVTLDRIEELHIRGVLAAAPSNEAAARTLGIDTVTLWRRRKAYGI